MGRGTEGGKRRERVWRELAVAGMGSGEELCDGEKRSADVEDGRGGDAAGRVAADTRVTYDVTCASGCYGTISVEQRIGN